MSRSNYDKPFYVDAGTSVVAVRCASNHDIILEYDCSRNPALVKRAEAVCDRMNKEAEIGRPRRNCDVGTTKEEQIRRCGKSCLDPPKHWKPSEELTLIQRCDCPCYEPKEQEKMRNLSFAEAMEHFKKGRLIRRAGDRLWCWLGKSGNIYYGLKRDCPLQFRDTWLTSDIFADDWDVQEEGARK